MLFYAGNHLLPHAFLVVSLILKLAVAIDFYTEQPTWLPPCKIYEPAFIKCSTNSIQKLIDQLVIGIPVLTAELGTIDPLKLDKVVFKQDNNEAATIRANITDMLVKGFNRLTIKESRVSKKDFSWNTKVFMPNMRIEGKYKMAGRVLLIPLTGNGKFFIELENLNILMHTKTRLFEKGGFTFYNVTEVHAPFDITKASVYFDNLFNGNSKEVERSTNQFFNDNWRDFLEALRPLIQETVERVMLNLLHKTFLAIPANFFVEDIPTSTQLYAKNSPEK